jgi:hypothetical protein
VPGHTSLVWGSGLAIDVGVECSWCSCVVVFQHSTLQLLENSNWARRTCCFYEHLRHFVDLIETCNGLFANLSAFESMVSPTFIDLGANTSWWVGRVKNW